MFEEQWRTDENIMLILCGIALFSPDRAKIVHKDVIKLEQVYIFKIIFFRTVHMNS